MSSKHFRNFSRHIHLDSRDRNIRRFHRFILEFATITCAIFHACRRYVVDNSQRMRQDNEQVECKSKSISNALKDFE